MAFLDKLTDIASKIGDKATDIAQNIGDKTSDAIEIGKLNSKINSERTEEGVLIKKLGEYLYTKFQNGEVDGLDEAALAICHEADTHTKAIADLQEQVNAIKADAEAAKEESENPAASAEAAQEAAAPVCVACGAALAADVRFCPNCGAKVEAPAPKGICPNCGEKNPEDSNFCSGCGAKLS